GIMTVGGKAKVSRAAEVVIAVGIGNHLAAKSDPAQFMEPPRFLLVESNRLVLVEGQDSAAIDAEVAQDRVLVVHLPFPANPPHPFAGRNVEDRESVAVGLHDLARPRENSDQSGTLGYLGESVRFLLGGDIPPSPPLLGPQQDVTTFGRIQDWWPSAAG